MDGVRRIAKNIGVLGFSELVVKALQLVMVVYIARIFREVEFGVFNFAIAFSTIGVILVDMGLFTLLIREISRNKDAANKYISNALIMKILLSFASFFIVAGALNFLGYDLKTRIIVYAFYLSFILKSFTDLFSSAFLAFEKMEWDALLKISRAVILALLVFYVLFNEKQLLLIGIMYVITELAILIAAIVVLSKKFWPLKIIFDFGFMKSLFRQSIPFALTVVFYNIYFYLDSIMLSKMKGPYEVGVYGAAYTIPIALISIPFIYTSAIFPLLSRYYINSRESLVFAYERSLKYMSIASLPISIALFFGSEYLIDVLYKGGFRESSMVLKILSIVVFFRFVSYLNGIFLASINMQKARVKWQGLTSLLNILLNFALIPTLSYIGAAIATLITEFFLLIAYSYLVIKHSIPGRSFMGMIKTLTAAILTALLFFIDIPPRIKILASLALFFLLIAILRVFDKEDIKILRRVLSGSSNKVILRS